MSYSSHDLSDTIVALATPPGVGAIGVIRLSGAKAIAIADEVFYGKKLAQQPSHTIHFGTIRDDSGRVLDEVLASLFVAPASYTGEHVVEFSCHGSSFILQEVLQLLIRKGARLAQPGEFTLRAFLNGRMDLSQAEAVADLIASASQAAHQMALQQMRGGFSQEIQQLRQQLIDFASLVELELDFSEEDVAFANRSDLRQLVERILQVVSGLIRSFQLGNVIKNGVNTVIAGRPNAGKSTLLNALLNEERAIVSEIAGTTRDTIEEVINIQGIPFRLIDTAGIREAQDTIEAIGVERTLEKVRQSSLLLYVFDVAHTPAAEVRADLEKLVQPGTHVLLLANKMDLNPYTDFHSFFSRPSSHSGASESSGQGQEPEIQPNDWIPLIAREGMNVPYLKERLYDAILQEKVNLDSPLVSNARHLEALQKAADSLQRVLDGLDTGISADFVAMDIRAALRYLGEITGEVSTEDLLGNIFSRFCIGK